MPSPRLTVGMFAAAGVAPSTSGMMRHGATGRRVPAPGALDAAPQGKAIAKVPAGISPIQSDCGIRLRSCNITNRVVLVV